MVVLVLCESRTSPGSLCPSPTSPSPLLPFLSRTCPPSPPRGGARSWLPYYLSDAVHFSATQGNLLSNIYDVGGIVGGVVAGLLSDLVGGRRCLIVFPMLLFSPATLYMYRVLGDELLQNGVLMFFMGFVIGGPANQISATVSADLGRQGALKSNKEALATVSGIIDGSGSVGAAIMQGVVAFAMKKPDASSWTMIIYILCGVMGLSALLLTKLV